MSEEPTKKWLKEQTEDDFVFHSCLYHSKVTNKVELFCFVEHKGKAIPNTLGWHDSLNIDLARKTCLNIARLNVDRRTLCQDLKE